MPKIKLDHVVSCSSEDSVYVANNLLNNNTDKKWKNKTAGEASATVIFQLEKECKICGIDIGNENSAFIEVFVGRSSMQDSDYQIILAMTSFMTPMEAKNETNSSRVRLYTYNELTAATRDEKWNRIKVVCTQPFNKHIQYGLSFITLNTPGDTKTDDAPTTLGKFKIRSDSPNFLTAGSLFARRQELTTQKTPETITQEIKNASATPKRQPLQIQTPKNNTTPKQTGSTEKTTRNRNRKDLFYDSDDETANKKIDTVLGKVKLEEEKKKREAEELEKAKKLAKKEKTNESKKQNNKDVLTNSPGMSGTNKRKFDVTPKTTTQKKAKLQSKPFNELLQGVVFTISGMVNPERANLRSMALMMGAKYRPDWDKTCTHLICVFANTPKFNQVRGKGKIVMKAWVSDCHSQRKRLPWRRYALDRNDQGQDESEEEIIEQTEEEENDNDDDAVEFEDISRPTKKTDYLSGSDTDEEIEKILIKQAVKQIKPKTVNDNNDIDKNDAFNVDTDEETLEKNPKELNETIAKIFSTEIFYVDSNLDEDERSKLERLIKASNGVILSRISNVVDFIITNEDNVSEVRKRSSNAKYVKPQWIYECYDIQKLVPVENFELE